MPKLSHEFDGTVYQRQTSVIGCVKLRNIVLRHYPILEKR